MFIQVVYNNDVPLCEEVNVQVAVWLVQQGHTCHFPEKFDGRVGEYSLVIDFESCYMKWVMARYRLRRDLVTIQAWNGAHYASAGCLPWKTLVSVDPPPNLIIHEDAPLAVVMDPSKH